MGPEGSFGGSSGLLASGGRDFLAVVYALGYTPAGSGWGICFVKKNYYFLLGLTTIVGILDDNGDNKGQRSDGRRGVWGGQGTTVWGEG